jgi:fibronectin-binding autotransporter adhesin
LISNGEVSFSMQNTYTVTSTSPFHFSPAIDVSKQNSTGAGATLFMSSNAGSLESSGGAFIGNQANSAGTVVLGSSQGPATWNHNNVLSVGYSGQGTLRVEAGSKLTTSAGHIGANQGSTGTATVHGSGSQWANQTSLHLGYAGGNGTLNILNGGSVSNTVAYIAYATGSTGTVTVSGSGSQWTNNSGSSGLSVGYSGNGTLNVQNGGTVSNTQGFIGNAQGSMGAVTVSGAGAQWTNSSRLYVGYSGTGTLNVLSGGSVSNTEGVIGYGQGSTGTATVSGSGAQWTNSSTLSVGASGNGTLNVHDGGSVSSPGGTIGGNQGSTGTVTVSGVGSQWTNSFGLSVGSSGNGTLNILNGGSVSNTEGRIGYFQGSMGTATVSGNGSQWTNSSNLYVGALGNGTLYVLNGGLVSNVEGRIGWVQDSTGAATVSGDGSLWNNSSLYVGGHSGGIGGTGVLVVANGGMVQVANTMGVWQTGSISIQNAGAVHVAGALTNAGLIEIATGGTLSAGSGVNTGTLHNDGTYTGDLAVLDGGTVSGSGVFYGDVSIGDGGILSPGNSPGTLSAINAEFGGGGNFLFEINDALGSAGSDPGWDLLSLDGVLTISADSSNPFNINITSLALDNTAGVAANFDPTQKYSWGFVYAEGGINGFAEDAFLLSWDDFLNPLVKGSFFFISMSDDEKWLYLNYVDRLTKPGEKPKPDVVPEPSTFALFGLGAVGLLGARRRRRRALRIPSGL